MSVSVSWTNLTGFQRDLLKTIALMERHDVEPYGQGIAGVMRAEFGTDPNNGRLYTNLNELARSGLVEKGTVDKRTKCYALTDAAHELLAEATSELLDALGVGQPVAVVDGGDVA